MATKPSEQCGQNITGSKRLHYRFPHVHIAPCAMFAIFQPCPTEHTQVSTPYIGYPSHKGVPCHANTPCLNTAPTPHQVEPFLHKPWSTEHTHLPLHFPFHAPPPVPFSMNAIDILTLGVSSHTFHTMHANTIQHWSVSSHATHTSNPLRAVMVASW